MQDVVIRIKGDSTDIVKLGEELKKLGKVDADNAKQFEDNNKKQKKATQEQTSALKEVFGGLTDIKGQLIDIGKGIAGAFAVQAIINFGKESVNAFLEAELNAKKLASAVQNIGGEGTTAFQKLIDQSAELQSISIFSDDAIQQAQTQLVQFGLTSKEVEKLTPKILDLASATGTDLGQATDMVIQGINGQSRALKPLGLEFKNTGDKAENLAIISEKLGKFQGQTNEVLNTGSGFLANLANKYDDVKESVGGFILSLAGIKEKGQSDELLNQQSALNSLAVQLNDTNLKTNERKSIIEKMNLIYPTFLKGLDIEKVTNEDIFKRLKLVNDQYMMKITLSRFDEKNKSDLQDASDAQIKYSQATAKVTELLYKNVTAEQARIIAVNAGMEATNSLGIANMYVNQVQKDNEKLIVSGKDRYASFTKQQQELATAVYNAGKAQEELSETNSVANKILKERNQLQATLEKQTNQSVESEIEVKTKLGKTEDQIEKERIERDKKLEEDAKKKIANEELWAYAVEEANKKADEVTKQYFAEKIENEKRVQQSLLETLAIEEEKARIEEQNYIKAIDLILASQDKRRELFAKLYGDETDVVNLEYEKQVKAIEDRYGKEIKIVEDSGNDASALRDAQRLELEDAEKTHQDKLTDITKKSNDERKKNNAEFYNGITQGIEAFSNINQIAYNSDLSYYQKLLENKQISQEEFDAKQKEIANRKAERDKEIAIFQTIISTARAVTEALPNVALSILAGVIGATQLGVIISQPPPKFAKGTPFLKRGNNPSGVDTIPAMLNEGEAVIPAERNAENKGLADAWIKGNLDSYIHTNFVVPALKTQSKSQGFNDERFIDKLAKSISLNNTFNDSNLLESDKMSRKVLIEQNKLLKSIALKSSKNPYRF